jgi:poly-gamma-glutamate synthesis protein (capsule biosynthesis protein)
MNEKDNVVLLGVGDIAVMTYSPKWENLIRSIRGKESIFAKVSDMLNKADVAFCQLEIPLTDKSPFSLPQARRADYARTETAYELKRAGFDVVSFASNHCMDWGLETFFDTINALEKAGLKVVGVGKNLEEARKPVFVESKGVKIAFLAYNSILPMGYWATDSRPGCAPLRAFTLYEQIEHDQPGTPCRIHTFPHRQDLQAMISDIKNAKSKADIVILSLHWGIHFIPAVLADYQRDVAYAAIDAGADLILGHHPHILKPIEVYRDKVIFYSLCNFAADLPFTKEMLQEKGFKEIQKLNPKWIPDPECLYNLPPDAEKTIIAKCEISDGSIKKVSFLPVYIDRKTAMPEILKSGDKRFKEVVDYLEEITRSQGIDTEFTVIGDEVVLV